MGEEKEWLQKQLVPAIVAHNWPGASVLKAQLGNKSGGNASDGGFASFTYRLTLEVLPRDSTDVITENLLIKVSPEDPGIRQLQNSEVQFMNEIWMYETVVPEFEKLATRGGLSPLGLFPRCLLCSTHSSTLSTVVMQDLGGEEGFTLAQPPSDLDLSHATLAMRRIGCLLGLGYVLKAQQPEEYRRLTQGFKEARYLPELEENQNRFLRPMIERGLKKLRTRPECAALVQAVDASLANPFKRLCSLMQPREPAAVLCHGDFCRNNILFQYAKNGSPRDLCFIDFQTMRVASPATDLAFFLYLSVSPSVIQGAGLTTLLNIYHTSLVSTLNTFGVDDPWEGKVSALEQELGRHVLFAYTICSFFLPLMMTSGDDFLIEDMMKLSKEERERQDLAIGGEEATCRLEDILVDFRDRGFPALWDINDF